VCHKSGEKFNFQYAPFLGKMHPRAISSRHACVGTANASLSRPARRRQRGNNIFSRFRKRMTILRAEVHDAKANTGNEIGTNSRNAKRKAFTREDVSKRLKRLREDLKNTNNAGATTPSETTVGTRFSEVYKQILRSHIEFSNSPSFVSLVSLWVRADNRLNIPSCDITPSRETGGAVHVEHHDRHQR
jgi:hypothetical protein